MKFDVIIGNPPYNDADESKQKRNGATTQGATFYQRFIEKSLQSLNKDGVVSFVAPIGAYNSILKNGGQILHVHHIDGRCWPKVLSTKAWFFTNKKSVNIPVPTQTPSIFNKLLNLNHYVTPITRQTGAISTYSFTSSCFTETEDKVYKTSYVKSQGKKFQNHNPTQWDLPDTDLNVENLTILLKYFAPWFHFYGYQWYMWNKVFDYKWLNNETKPLTEKRIIEYYKLTKDDLKQIKLGN